MDQTSTITNPGQTIEPHQKVAVVFSVIMVLSVFSMMLNDIWVTTPNKGFYKLMIPVFILAALALTVLNIYYNDSALWTLYKGAFTAIGRLLIAWAVSWLTKLYIGAGAIVNIVFWYMVKLALFPPQVVEILARAGAAGRRDG